MSLKNELLQIFFESPAFDDTQKDLGDIQLGKRSKEIMLNIINTKPKLREVTKDNVKIGLYTLFETEWIVIGVEEPTKEIVMELSLYNYDDKSLLYPKMVSSVVYKKWQGKGYGKLGYKLAIEQFGGLLSDIKLTGQKGLGSFQVWESLSKEYKPFIYNIRERKKIYVKQITKDLMKTTGELFGVEK